ncbi:DUF4221 family protein [Algoriphagus sp. C2-6-M1]|uniref:DUF4221 family protein n=1 Tax=Algoriphagus persicinus TaxID=3108754 RepID=UPI002B37FE39|nr:DUF4221 family protein [Algoriphagus sp. C2-6-M1]MEB2779358.1 DUF4221 family protein [Algoriphagus sp. C2-6-M1]
MNRYIILLLGIALLSCNPEKNSTQTTSYDFSYSVDTIQIDAGNHLFFAGYGLQQPRLSPDEHFLYFYDNLAHAIEKVDLVNKEYVSTIDMDKEGPKGIPMPQDYVPAADQTVFFVVPRNFVKLDENGGLIYFSDKLDNLFDVPDEKKFFQSLRISPNQNYLFGMTSTFEQEQMLGWIDLNDSIYHEVVLDSMKYRDDLVVLINGGEYNSLIDAVYLNGEITVFHGDGIDLYTLDPKTEAWIFHDYSLKSVEKRKPGNYPKNVETGSESFKLMFNQRGKEINFRSLVYDASNKRYYRVASKWTESQDVKDIPYQYLFIFDEDLKLIHEEDLSNFQGKIFDYFVSNGKLWVHNRETEELEFFVFDFDLKEL